MTETKKAFKDWDISDSTSNLVYVGAWDTGAEYTSLSMKVIEAKKYPPTTGAASGCDLAVSALRRNDDILWARSDSPFLRGVGARLRYVFSFIY